MMHRKNNIVVGLTTFNNEMLRISVPVLGKIRQKFMLVVYNDNPMTNVTRRQIRRMGYCGDLQVINTNENVGELRARMAIVDAVRTMNPDWIIFCDDDDLLTNIDIPNVSPDNFAIMQNAIVIKHRVGDLLHAIDNPNEIECDGENIELRRPNMAIAGTPVRANVLIGLGDILRKISDAISDIDDGLDFCPPVDEIMWNFVNIYARSINPDAVPIYMDQTSYIKNDIDTARIKYGRLARPTRNANDQYHRIIDKYNAVLHSALDVAALRG